MGRTVVQISSLVPPARFGGAERVVEATTAGLERRGFTVRNIGLGPEPGPDVHRLRNLYWPWGDELHGGLARLAWHGIDVFVPLSRRAVGRVLDEIEPDVVVTHNIRGWGYAPWQEVARRGIPLVHVLHDYGLMCNAATMWRGEQCERLCTPCRPRAAASNRRWPGGTVVAVSQALADEHRRQHSAVTAGEVIISHPLSAATPVPTGSTLRVGPPAVVGYLGRVGENKGVDQLVRAATGGTQRVLVGGTGEAGFIESLKAPANVEFLGWCDPAQFYPRLDLLVVPSVWREPFGLIVVEAARAGVPVLLADQPGLIEAARAAGARYSTFVPGDVDDLRTALTRPLSSYRSDPVTPATDLVDVIATTAATFRDQEALQSSWPPGNDWYDS